MRLGYLDKNFIEDELYKRLGHVNYHLRKEPFGQASEANARVIKKVYTTKKPTKVTYKCSNCRKIGYRKNKYLKLENFIEDELYKRLGHVNYHLRKEPFGQASEANARVIKKVYTTKKPTKVTYKCSNCRKIGYRKNKYLKLDCSGSYYTYQFKSKNSDQEDEPMIVLNNSDEKEFEDKESIFD
ncbi:hypothetical protein Glove_41g51 [Diversispora epigaea]|uniref:Uncharacterized protein n=1 Tax=Diversispora epigaea TaxID=1348612 RepID=A0A397JQ21_9GLOM|nr:hypothetical protein Glove_41g51 [Diversispora epigaea]